MVLQAAGYYRSLARHNTDKNNRPDPSKDHSTGAERPLKNIIIIIGWLGRDNNIAGHHRFSAQIQVPIDCYFLFYFIFFFSGDVLLLLLFGCYEYCLRVGAARTWKRCHWEGEVYISVGGKYRHQQSRAGDIGRLIFEIFK